jgi:hypothetical protein
VAPAFHFEHELPFSAALAPDQTADLLREIPAVPGVFALFGPEGSAQPYLTRAADLRRRIRRLVDPAPVLDAAGQPTLSKRLNLRDKVARICWSVTGSEFESLFCLYHAASSLFGPAEARRRLKLRTPFFLRFTAEHAHPRIYVTNRLSRRSLATTYGPFPSRSAAERFADAALDLFRLRRCHEDLEVHPEHPGCAYGEMKKCMAPCNTGCTADEYAAEAAAVRAFLDTRGESLLAAIARERDQASEQMDFESAAASHKQYEKVKSAAMLAPELVRPIPELRAVIVQPAVKAAGSHPEQAAVFLLERGCLAGPARLSTLGVRAVREQTSVGSSLFAQPLMLQAIPLAPESSTPGDPTAVHPSETPVGTPENPEERASAVLAHLASETSSAETDPATLSDHLALLRRWFYRPEKARSGEILFPNPDGSWPLRRILRAAARTAIGDPRPIEETDREGAKAIRTKVLHAGREGVERVVPDLSSIAVATGDSPSPTFRSRRKRESRP